MTCLNKTNSFQRHKLHSKPSSQCEISCVFVNSTWNLDVEITVQKLKLVIVSLWLSSIQKPMT